MYTVTDLVDTTRGDGVITWNCGMAKVDWLSRAGRTMRHVIKTQWSRIPPPKAAQLPAAAIDRNLQTMDRRWRGKVDCPCRAEVMGTTRWSRPSATLTWVRHLLSPELDYVTTLLIHDSWTIFLLQARPPLQRTTVVSSVSGLSDCIYSFNS